MKKFKKSRVLCDACDEPINDKIIECFGELCEQSLDDHVTDYMTEDRLFCCPSCQMACIICDDRFMRDDVVDFICDCRYDSIYDNGCICDDCSDKCKKCYCIYCIKCNIPCLRCTQEIIEKYMIRDITRIIFKYCFKEEIFDFYISRCEIPR